jgi:cobalt-zinc-cadmium efflux system outer membrane protein
MSLLRSTLITLVAFSPGFLTGQDATADLVRAVGGAPVLEAARQRIEAARSRIDASGRLADPEAEGMFSRGPGNRDMWELNVKQPLPKRGERAADRDRARAAVTMAAADYALMAGELAADVAVALAEAEGAQARAKVLEAQRARFDSVLKSIEARLATATTTRFADRLTIQTRIAGMQLEIEEAEKSALDALADSRGRLGLAPDATLPGFSAPIPTEISHRESALSNAAEARVAEADAAAKIARASAKPSTAVGLRLERERGNMGNEDRVGVAFSSEIPWRSRTYAKAELRAAESERNAANAEGSGARFRITSALSRVERAERLAETARRIAGETRARLDAQYDALVRAAGAGSAAGAESTVLLAVEIFEQASAAELKVIEADTAARRARAELWRYAPTSRFLTSNN